jgi:hypothetical protein
MEGKIVNCQESETKVKKNYVSSELIALIYYISIRVGIE